MEINNLKDDNATLLKNRGGKKSLVSSVDFTIHWFLIQKRVQWNEFPGRDNPSVRKNLT